MSISIEELYQKFPHNKVVLYDDNCNLCLFWKGVVEKRDKKNLFYFEDINKMNKESLKKNKIPTDLSTVILVQKSSGKNDYEIQLRSDAILTVFSELPFPCMASMYSKAGRDTVERYAILQHAEEIMNSAKPDHKTISSLASPKQSLASSRQLGFLSDYRHEERKSSVIGTLFLKPKDNDNKAKKKTTEDIDKELLKFKKSQPMSKITSRDKRERALGSKKAAPATTTYKPKYTLIDKTTGVYVDFDKSKKRSISEHSLNNMTDPLGVINNRTVDSVEMATSRSSDRRKMIGKFDLSYSPVSIIKPSKNLGCISFDLQLSREDVNKSMIKKEGEYSDRLGGSVDIPANLTTNRKVIIPDISKVKGRGENDFLPKITNCPTYEPNYDIVKKRLDKGFHDLTKMTKRKPLAKKAIMVHETVYDLDLSAMNNTGKSIVLPKINSPSFKKMLPREINSNSKFPGYLQGLPTRISLNSQNEKSLLFNHYKEGRFQTNISSFEISSQKDNNNNNSNVNTNTYINTNNDYYYH